MSLRLFALFSFILSVKNKHLLEDTQFAKHTIKTIILINYRPPNNRRFSKLTSFIFSNDKKSLL